MAFLCPSRLGKAKNKRGKFYFFVSLKESVNAILVFEQTHNVATTSLRRRNVVTMFCDVMCLLNFDLLLTVLQN